jgi:WhiB family redox-sensing transcriptional regulator
MNKNQQRVQRTDAVYRLLGSLPGSSFGGTPACSDKDPELFFPLDKQTGEIKKAKAVCAGCPVKKDCLRFALNNGEQGVWGGTTESERVEMRRTGRRVA